METPTLLDQACRSKGLFRLAMLWQRPAADHSRYMASWWSAMFSLPLLMTLVVAEAAAQEITLSQVSVIDLEEAPGPVPSEIVHFLPREPSKPVPIGDTDHYGQLALEFKCGLGTKVQARPHDSAYMYSRKAHCSSIMRFQVQPITIQVRLQENMDKAAEIGDFAAAALAATELASMDSRSPEQVAGEAAEFLSIVYAATALGVDEGLVFDKSQSRTVISAKLQAALQGFQLEAGIEVTGQLDYNTLATMSQTTSGLLRHRDYQPNRM